MRHLVLPSHPVNAYYKIFQTGEIEDQSVGERNTPTLYPTIYTKQNWFMNGRFVDFSYSYFLLG
jgi:hypothetical protein